MSERLRRRMAMSRQMLRRPLVRPDAVASLERPLSDDELAEVLDHDVAHWRQEASLLDRAIRYIDARIRAAQQDLMVKRQELQAAWMRMEALESERRQILADQEAADRKNETR